MRASYPVHKVGCPNMGRAYGFKCSFIKAGMTVAIDGSQKDEINIEGLE